MANGWDTRPDLTHVVLLGMCAVLQVTDDLFLRDAHPIQGGLVLCRLSVFTNFPAHDPGNASFPLNLARVWGSSKAGWQVQMSSVRCRFLVLPIFHLSHIPTLAVVVERQVGTQLEGDG